MIKDFIDLMPANFLSSNFAAYIKDLNERGYMQVEMSEPLIHFYNQDWDFEKWEYGIWIPEKEG